MWFRKQKNNPCDYDLAVVGDSLGGYVAVLAALEQGLRVVWLRSECGTGYSIEAEPACFDSLSPEGARYLAHILAPADIEHLQRGRFGGINRNGIYSPFNQALGCGFQFSIVALKQLLMQKIMPRAKIIQNADAIFAFDRNCLRISTHTTPEHILCHWAINAEGEFSLFSRQMPTYLSEDLWVVRNFGDRSMHYAGDVFFCEDDISWRWIAYDDEGLACETRWRTPRTGISIPHNAVNARWYKRACCLEYYDEQLRPVILIGSTFFRVDPACGLGATLQVKSALYAVACIARCLSGSVQAPGELASYQAMMDATFNEVAQPMADFYQAYGVRAGKYYTVVT